MNHQFGQETRKIFDFLFDETTRTKKKKKNICKEQQDEAVRKGQEQRWKRNTEHIQFPLLNQAESPLIGLEEVTVFLACGESTRVTGS